MSRQEALLIGRGTEGGRCRAEGSSAIGDGEQATILFTPDIDGMQAHIFESLQLEGAY